MKWGWLMLPPLFWGMAAWAQDVPVPAEDGPAGHLAAFIARDMAGDGFDRLGPFLEPSEGRGSGCGCASSGNHFDIAGDPVLVADRWRIGRVEQGAQGRAVAVVRFHLLADSRMMPVSFAQGRFRRLRLFAKSRWLVRRYSMERRFDGAWAILADQEPVVAAAPLAQALDAAETAAASRFPAAQAYYGREASKAHRLMLRGIHKVLAD